MKTSALFGNRPRKEDSDRIGAAARSFRTQYSRANEDAIRKRNIEVRRGVSTGIVLRDDHIRRDSLIWFEAG